MGRKRIHLDQRKISLTISVAYPVWIIAKTEGNKKITDAIDRGLWALTANISELSIEALKHEYENKIIKLQKIIEQMGAEDIAEMEGRKCVKD